MIRAEFCLLSLLLVFLSLVAVQSAPSEEKLVDEILVRRRYHRMVRPAKNYNDAVEVKYGYSLQKILNVDFDTDSATLDIWENYEWTDYRFKWNETDFGGVSSIRLPPHLIWTPDIKPYGGRFIERDQTDVVIYSLGLVSWVPTGIITIPCDTTKEKIKCTLKAGSWTFDGTKLNLTNRADEVDTSSYAIRKKFDLLEAPCKRTVKKYECCPEPYIDIACTFTFTMLE